MKIVILIHSMKFLFSEIALCLHKSTIKPCIEYCCHAWAGDPNCYLNLLDMLQKPVCRTFGSILAASLELLAHHQDIASFSLHCRYYLGRCSSELTSWFHFLILVGGPPSCWRRSGVFIVNFEHISHLVLVFLLLTLSR